MLESDTLGDKITTDGAKRQLTAFEGRRGGRMIPVSGFVGSLEQRPGLTRHELSSRGNIHEEGTDG